MKVLIYFLIVLMSIVLLEPPPARIFAKGYNSLEICGCCEDGGECYCPPQADCRKTCPKCSSK